LTSSARVFSSVRASMSSRTIKCSTSTSMACSMSMSSWPVRTSTWPIISRRFSAGARPIPRATGSRSSRPIFHRAMSVARSNRSGNRRRCLPPTNPRRGWPTASWSFRPIFRSTPTVQHQPSRRESGNTPPVAMPRPMQWVNSSRLLPRCCLTKTRS